MLIIKPENLIVGKKKERKRIEINKLVILNKPTIVKKIEKKETKIDKSTYLKDMLNK